MMSNYYASICSKVKTQKITHVSSIDVKITSVSDYTKLFGFRNAADLLVLITTSIVDYALNDTFK